MSRFLGTREKEPEQVRLYRDLMQNAYNAHVLFYHITSMREKLVMRSRTTIVSYSNSCFSFGARCSHRLLWTATN